MYFYFMWVQVFTQLRCSFSYLATLPGQCQVHRLNAVESLSSASTLTSISWVGLFLFLIKTIILFGCTFLPLSLKLFSLYRLLQIIFFLFRQIHARFSHLTVRFFRLIRSLQLLVIQHLRRCKGQSIKYVLLMIKCNELAGKR